MNSEEGTKGEARAAYYLEGLGYRIVGKNCNYPGVGELDLVALDKNTLVFVEVRARSSLAFGHPFETVDRKKRAKTLRAADRFLSETALRYDDVRFDLIAVIGDEIEHLIDAYYGRWLR